MPKAPDFQLLRATDYQLTPWKNGGGVTAAIASHPPLATTDNFQWRLSLATVESSGPFSIFPDVDRIIVLTEGLPLELDHGKHGHHVLRPLSPHAFDGAWTTSAKLLGLGMRRDFNLMVRRSFGTARLEVVHLASHETLLVDAPKSMRALHVYSGALQVAGPHGAQAVAACGDTVLVPSGVLKSCTAQSSSIVLDISIIPHAPSAT